MRASLYKIECGTDNLPIVSCCVHNAFYESEVELNNNIKGLESVFHSGAIFIACTDPGNLLVIQYGNIIASDHF